MGVCVCGCSRLTVNNIEKYTTFFLGEAAKIRKWHEANVSGKVKNEDSAPLYLAVNKANANAKAICTVKV